jgi:hypothetical protein
MNETDNQNPADDVNDGTIYQVDALDFLNTQNAVRAVRLTIKEAPIELLHDVLNGLEGARRLFEKGELKDIRQAVEMVNYQFSLFMRKVEQWENQANQRERFEMQYRGRMSTHEKEKMVREHTRVRQEIRIADRQFTLFKQKCEGYLRLLESEVRKQKITAESVEQAAQTSGDDERPGQPDSAVPQTDQGAVTLPDGFREEFAAAAEPSERQAIVEEFFDKEADITANIVSIPEKGKRVRFEPFNPLPTNRFYFFPKSGQLLRLRRAPIVTVVYAHDPVTNKMSEIPLAEFVEHTNKGIWLLTPRSEPGKS